MNKVRAIKAFVLGMALTCVMAVPAWATSHPTRESVKTDVITEATPYFTSLIGIVVALFGLALLVTLARKAAAMAKGGIRRG